METRMRWIRLALLVTLLSPAAALAQGMGQGGGGNCPGCAGPGKAGARNARWYDPATVTTVQGEIVEVKRLAGARHAGVHLTLATGAEKLDVHLGPDFYVDRQAVKLASGDRVEVKGSRVTMGGAPAILAQEVRRGADVLALRDANGVPLWRGQGRR